MLTLQLFTDDLRYALEHLYDPDQLQSSPLKSYLTLEGRVDSSTALQRILSKAIESLEPDETTPAQARAWRLYELLVCRYLQQASVPEVANQLGISHRHLRREQNAALEMLARRLWQQFDLDTKRGEVGVSDTKRTNAPPEAIPNVMPNGHEELAGITPAISSAGSPTESPTVDDELSWLRNLSLNTASDLNEILPSILELVHSLATHNQVILTTAIGRDLPDVAVHPIAVRQLLLSLFNFALMRTPGGQLNVSTQAGRRAIHVQIYGQPSVAGLQSASHDELIGIEVVQKLATLCRVSVTFSMQDNTFLATLTFPVREQFQVLIIDDNSDTQALLQRYAQGTHYRLFEATDPSHAVRMAADISPHIIVLDVMMPKIDGWEVLARLRQHPQTHSTPIIICTILALESLALSLGASAFVRKPITKAAFLTVLDQQLEEWGTALR